jgi:hypothetical protein
MSFSMGQPPGPDDGVVVFALNLSNDGFIEIHYAEAGDVANGCMRTHTLMCPVEGVDLADILESFRQAHHDAEVFMRRPMKKFKKTPEGEEEIEE